MNRYLALAAALLWVGAGWAADEPPAGNDWGERVGLAVDGLRAIGHDAEGGQSLDYTFNAAPVDWLPGGGRWAVSARYACDPEWSFYGGQSRGLCALWNKREFAGDLVVEAYVAFKHGLPWAPEHWYYVPTDLNLTIGADLGDLSSGTSFVYSGRGGTTTMIRRGDQILAQTQETDKVLPAFTDHNPYGELDETGLDYGGFHRHWWRLEARRTGGRLTFSVDGRQLLDVADPEPARPGHIALWTVGSGFVIARARVAYGAELRPAQPLVVVRQPTSLP